jgi:putative iron-regulated protein
MTLRLSERPFGRCILAVLFVALISPSIVFAADTAPTSTPVTAAAVVENYANIAEAGYLDAHTSAVALQTKIKDLIAAPSDATMLAAREAWKAARVPYMQTEVFRFGNSIVDDWEGKVNAWPLDEGLIDYVSGAYGADSPENEMYAANVIANPSLKIAGKQVDAAQITAKLLSETLNEAGGVESNVATGYHAIEFLLWGQDLNGTKAGAGARPASDYDVKNCSHGNCDRRGQYLTVVTQLLTDDLDWMAKQWSKNGAARAAVAKSPGSVGLTAIFTGLGSLSRGELAGDRMQVGLLVHDPEEEHDCFSDNTHNSHYYDTVGMQNVYLGHYKRLDGSMVSGPGIGEFLRAKSADADQRIVKALDATLAKMTVLVERANAGEAYDMMIGEGNLDGNAAVQSAIDALVSQTKEIERGIAALGLNSIQFDGSSGHDGPSKAGAAEKDKG